MSEENNWVPEIMYEEDIHGVSQTLPFILVPPDEAMPRFILLWEHRDTGEIEPGPDGEDLPIVEADLRQYARMDVLKDKLSEKAYDDVRLALGLAPLKEASAAGRKISASVRDNVEKS